MVQFFNWLKSFFVKRSEVKLISFNKSELQDRLATCANELYGNSGTQIVKLLQDVLVTSRNIQILESNLIDPAKDCQLVLAYHKARIACLSDLLGWIERAVSPEDFKRRTKQQQPSGTKTMFRRHIQSGRPFAGPAI